MVFVNYMHDVVVDTQFHKFYGRPFLDNTTAVPVRLLSPTRYPRLRSCSKLPLAVYKLHGTRKIAASAIPSQRQRWSPNEATTPWLS